MRKRHKVGRKASKRLFTRTAKLTHVRNVHGYPMRGGIRF